MLDPGGIKDALHLVIDMQRLFAEATDWQVADLPAILPGCAALLRHRPDAAAFARFQTPASAEGARGRWQGYYRHWAGVTLDRMDAALLDVVEPLARLAPAAPRIDKAGYSAFSSPDLAPLLKARGCRTLILSGVETDVCVLATAFEAVDRGLRVIVARDAVTSGLAAGHRAALDILQARFDLQVELADTAEIIAAWTG